MVLTDLIRRKQQCAAQIQLSEEARVILDSPMVKEFFDKAEVAMIEKWKSSPDDALEARERLYALLKMLHNFKAHFEGYIINGRFAENELEKIMAEEKQKR